MRRLALFGALVLFACAESSSIIPTETRPPSLQSVTADTVLQLYLEPDGPLVKGTDQTFVHLRVLVGGSPIPASEIFASFTSDHPQVISLPHGALLDDDRTRVVTVNDGAATLRALWTVNGKDYRVQQQFTVGALAATDTTIQLYLKPDRALVPGDNEVFVHARVLVGGTAIDSSTVFTTFVTSDSTVLGVPNGHLSDDDRTRLFPHRSGKAVITAHWAVNGRTYDGSREFDVAGAAADTTIELYLQPDQPLVAGDTATFVHARVLVGGTALPQSAVFTSFTSDKPSVLEVPNGALLDDDRTRLLARSAGTATITARWTRNGKAYTGAREFTVQAATSPPPAPVDTVVQLYLEPSKALVAGDNSVFVHTRILIGGSALPASQVFSTFITSNARVLDVPNGALPDDDRTRLHAVAAGSATITGRWTANGKTYTGTATYTVTEGGAPPPTGSYSPTSPHWTHIRTRVTDYYYNWNSAMRDTVAGRFDLVLGGDRGEWLSRNPAVRMVPYRLHWSVPQQGSDWQSFTNWFAANPECDMENAFLHRAGTSRAPEHRISATVWQAPRWILNPADPCWRRYAQHRIAQTLAQGWHGVFYDEYSRNNWQSAGAFSSLELPGGQDAYFTALEEALKGERAAFPNAIILVNTAEYIDAWHGRLIDAAGSVHLELFNDLLHGVMEERWDFAEARLDRGNLVEFMGRRNWRGWLPPDVTPGNYRDGSLDGFHQGMYRQKMGELASYYLIRPVDPSKFYFENNNANWTALPTAHWMRALEMDVGTPTERRRRIINTTGSDGQHVVVWARHYTRAYILTRPTTDWTITGYGDASAHTVPLPSPMRLLRHDGTLGPVITEIALRKGEGAVLFKE